jgi:hypothetical protein
MPLLTLRTNASVDDDAIAPLLKDCSGRLANMLGKPEGYVMTLFERASGMTMAGELGPACFVEVRSVGKITSVQARAISEAFCGLLSDRLGVGSERIYLNFTEFSGAHWGHDGGTFG